MSKKYIVVDADTIVVQAAMSVQTNYCVYKDNKFVCQTPSKKQWVADNPEEDVSLYEFRKEARLKPTNEQMLFGRCKKQIRSSFQEIQDKYPDRTMIIVLEAEGNHREERYPEYKAQRDGEIILRKKLSQWVGREFKNVKFAVGCESDDLCAQYAFRGYRDFVKTGEYSFVIAAIDKDARTVPSRIYNYRTKEECDITPLEATRFFCYQILFGDGVDNVKGLNHPISKELCDKFGIKKTGGMGELTASAILANCETEKQCFERVIECYKDVYSDEWLDKLQFEAYPLRMQRIANEDYDIRKHFDYLGIDYER